MLLALALTALTVVVEDEAPSPPVPTSRWGAAAGTSFRLGVLRGVNNALGPRFALFAPPESPSERFITPAIALLFEGEIGTQRGTGAVGAEVRVELLVCPGGGLLAPWAVAWISGGAGAAWLGAGHTGATELFHVGIGIGGNAFADGGAWGPNYSWADWMEGITWPVVLFATLVGLPVALVHVELRWTFYPDLGASTGFPSVLLGFGM